MDRVIRWMDGCYQIWGCYWWWWWWWLWWWRYLSSNSLMLYPSSIQSSHLYFSSSLTIHLFILSMYIYINHFAAPIAVKRHVVCATSLVIYPWNAVRIIIVVIILMMMMMMMMIVMMMMMMMIVGMTNARGLSGTLTSGYLLWKFGDTRVGHDVTYDFILFSCGEDQLRFSSRGW